MSQYQLDVFALVVGAAGGIGREVAHAFAEAGVQGILFADIKTAAVVDVVDNGSVQAMVDLAVKEYGRMDYCVNAAGIDNSEYVPLDQTSLEDYEHVMDTNAKSIFLVIKAVAKVMKSQHPVTLDLGRLGKRDVGRGSIVNVSSMMAVVAGQNRVSYATLKHAITGITRSAVMDCRLDGIRTNQVCPIWVRTPPYIEETRKAPQTLQIVEGLSAIKRPIEPDEVAAALLILM
ncbi:oxidoreductase [Xylariaceae sp. FL1019]|nr:oxidoreductase [Xylariaceae sp. FL1019]